MSNRSRSIVDALRKVSPTEISTEEEPKIDLDTALKHPPTPRPKEEVIQEPSSEKVKSNNTELVESETDNERVENDRSDRRNHRASAWFREPWT